MMAVTNKGRFIAMNLPLSMCYGVGGLLTLLHLCLEVCENVEVAK